MLRSEYFRTISVESTNEKCYPSNQRVKISSVELTEMVRKCYDRSIYINSTDETVDIIKIGLIFFGISLDSWCRTVTYRISAASFVEVWPPCAMYSKTCEQRLLVCRRKLVAADTLSLYTFLERQVACSGVEWRVNTPMGIPHLPPPAPRSICLGGGGSTSSFFIF